jgi:ADP-ribose pyrophosphatase YjhB (NUDIX family)
MAQVRRTVMHPRERPDQRLEEPPAMTEQRPGRVSAEPQWLAWARRIQAIAQTGLSYSHGPYDRDRYQALRALAVEILAANLEVDSQAERLRLSELFAADSGYPTPKVDVRAFVAVDGKVLMVRELADGHWSIPGGWADVGSTPAEMAVREVAEESGYRVRARRLLAVWDRARHNPTPHPSSVYKLAIASDRLPPLSLGRITQAQVRRLAELDANPQLPPDLD